MVAARGTQGTRRQPLQAAQRRRAAGDQHARGATQGAQGRATNRRVVERNRELFPAASPLSASLLIILGLAASVGLRSIAFLSEPATGSAARRCPAAAPSCSPSLPLST